MSQKITLNDKVTMKSDYLKKLLLIAFFGGLFIIFSPSQAMAQLQVISTATDVNGGTLVANDVIEYTYTVTNIGTDTILLIALNNTMPTNTTYVSSSMKIDGVSKTDGILDDQAEYSGLGKQVTLRIGGGATVATGGGLAGGASTVVKFRVKVNAGVANGTAITNQATVNHTAVINVNSDSNPDAAGDQPNVVYINTTPPSIQLAHSVLPTGHQPPKTDLTFTSTFTNSGGSSAQNFAVSEPVPANTYFKLSSASATLTNTGLTSTVQYSNDNGVTFTYTPVSGRGSAPSGYDGTVTNIRYVFTGSLSATAPNNTGTVTYSAQIK